MSVQLDSNLAEGWTGRTSNLRCFLSRPRSLLSLCAVDSDPDSQSQIETLKVPLPLWGWLMCYFLCGVVSLAAESEWKKKDAWHRFRKHGFEEHSALGMTKLEIILFCKNDHLRGSSTLRSWSPSAPFFFFFPLIILSNLQPEGKHISCWKSLWMRWKEIREVLLIHGGQWSSSQTVREHNGGARGDTGVEQCIIQQEMD